MTKSHLSFQLFSHLTFSRFMSISIRYPFVCFFFPWISLIFIYFLFLLRIVPSNFSLHLPRCISCTCYFFKEIH